MLIFKAISSLKKRISSKEIPTVEYLLDEESHFFIFFGNFFVIFPSNKFFQFIQA